MACVVVQTNIGYGYVCHTLEELGIDPGLNCTKYAYEMEKMKNKDIARKKFHSSNVEINCTIKEFKGLQKKKNGKAKPTVRIKCGFEFGAVSAGNYYK